MKRTQVLHALLAGAVAAAMAGLACSSAAPLGNEGDPCSQPADCASNLTCVPQTDGTRICSSNLAPIQHTEEAGAEGAAPPKEAGGPPPEGGPKTDSGTSTVDSGGGGMDTGTVVQDTGTPPMDTGTTVMDTYVAPQDTGSPPQDSSMPTDATGG